MTEEFRHDLESCDRITPSQWRKRPIVNKTIESIIRLLSPIL